MNTQEDSRPIYLVGFRGVGKTSTARFLADKLGREWLDCDAEIENCAGCTITAMFQRDGEGAFRQIEADVLRRLSRSKDAVISTGGGAVLRHDNRRVMKETGFVAWLQASPETIHRRLEKDPGSPSRRPTLTGRPLDEEIRCLLEERAPFYRDVASFEISTDDYDPEQVAVAIVDAFARSSQTTS